MTDEIDTSAEAVERHLRLESNHEAGLIPIHTQLLLRALAAERDALRQRKRELLDRLAWVEGERISWRKRAEAGIASDVRAALRQDEGDE